MDLNIFYFYPLLQAPFFCHLLPFIYHSLLDWYFLWIIIHLDHSHVLFSSSQVPFQIFVLKQRFSTLKCISLFSLQNLLFVFAAYTNHLMLFLLLLLLILREKEQEDILFAILFVFLKEKSDFIWNPHVMFVESNVIQDESSGRVEGKSESRTMDASGRWRWMEIELEIHENHPAPFL